MFIILLSFGDIILLVSEVLVGITPSKNGLLGLSTKESINSSDILRVRKKQLW